ncbi:hypothetical protein DdX_16369 [Ditylenchus destructor]|uniref:Uncharacterized protein n=1 Tax=Ditylenchus destructor TaxID=166010 RepID=A0AAD4MQH6_9BILA|nr:hypothetical protein DdX_16369 [Ditylenchus destructor]
MDWLGCGLLGGLPRESLAVSSFPLIKSRLHLHYKSAVNQHSNHHPEIGQSVESKLNFFCQKIASPENSECDPQLDDIETNVLVEDVQNPLHAPVVVPGTVDQQDGKHNLFIKNCR